MHIHGHTRYIHAHEKKKSRGAIYFTVAEVPGMQAGETTFRLLPINLNSVVTATIYVRNLKRFVQAHASKTAL